MKKLSIGLFSLTGCEGCYFSIIDLREKFLVLKDYVEIKNFRLFEDKDHSVDEEFDIVFVEGSPLTEANIDKLQYLREHCQTLVALGSCAHIGGIYHLKTYHDKHKLFNNIYNGVEGIENLDCWPISKYVQVDHFIPGCPITATEFLKFIFQFIIGKNPKLLQNPVCYDCQTRGYECLLQNGELCLGPITCAGCNAICVKSGQGCWGCRGLVDSAEVDNLVRQLQKTHSDKAIIQALEVFGIKEFINK